MITVQTRKYWGSMGEGRQDKNIVFLLDIAIKISMPIRSYIKIFYLKRHMIIGSLKHIKVVPHSSGNEFKSSYTSIFSPWTDEH